MKKLSIFLAAVMLLFLAPREFMVAAGPEQLEEGKATLRGQLNEGDLQKALTLLESAAEELPASVDAQLTLAECYMKLGQINDAVGQYRKVLKLSPDHRQAKQIVEVLTGTQVSVEQQLAVVRDLVGSSALTQARVILGSLARRPMDSSQRQAANLMRAEAELWANMNDEALRLAMQLIKETQNAEIIGPARVIAALALPPSETATAERLIADAGNVGEPWSTRASLVTLADRLKDPAKAAAASAGLGEILKTIPTSEYRTRLSGEARDLAVAAAERKLARRDLDGALAIAWPMIGSGPVPTADAVLKRVKLQGGWLIAEAEPVPRAVSKVVHLLAGIGHAETLQQGSGASLLGYWLAAEAARQAPGSDLQLVLNVAQMLAAESRPAAGRKSGDVLCRADAVQRQILLSIGDDIVGRDISPGSVADAAVDQILGQIRRYHVAGDAETGLKQFVNVDEEEPPSLQLAGSLNLLPENNRRKLLEQLASAYAVLGEEAFEQAEATLAADANESLNRFEKLALSLSNQLLPLSREDGQDTKPVEAIVERYAAKQAWAAARQAWTIYYTGREGNEQAWSAIFLKTRQAEYEDGQRLSAQRKLGDELAPLVAEAIGDAVAVYKQDPSNDTRQRTTLVLRSLIDRYANLHRWDLAEAVIAAAAKADDAKLLADWSLWSRANLLARRSAIAMQIYAPQHADSDPPPLHDLHKAELALIQQLLNEHAESELRAAAVNRVSQISSLYQSYRSFDVARAVLTDFLKEQPNLSSGPEIELSVVRVDLAKARDAFAGRDDKKTPPVELPPEHAAAIESIAAFLTKHPTGHLARTAEDELFAVARTFGETDSWPLVRGVLDRFAASVPDYRSPLYLRLLQAVTHLGELDRAYAMALLAPEPTGGDRPSRYGGGGFGGLAAVDGYYQGRHEGSGEDSPPNISGQPNASGTTANAPSQPPSSAVNGGLPAIDPFGAAPGFAVGGGGAAEPSETALAMIRQSQQRQYQQIAMLEQRLVQADNSEGQQAAQQQGPAQPQSIALPTGVLLSEEELERQSAAADQAYKILIQIVKDASADEAPIAQQARGQILWLFGFFEGQQRFDQAIALIQRYLTDRPDDPAKVALAFQSINDQLSQAGRRQSTDRITLAWLDERHKLFSEARAAIEKFIADSSDKKEWIHRARLLIAESFDREAGLAANVSAVRSGGLLVRSAEVLLALPEQEPDHAAVAHVSRRVWDLAERLRGLQQENLAIYLLSQIPIQFPTDPLAPPSVLRIAELHAAGLEDPLKAVETYQEYINTNGDSEDIRAQIFSIGQQLAGKRRFLEALHVFGVFVDSFPTDQRAPEALRQIGQTHQSNEAWKEAMASYQRIIDEYPNVAIIPDVKLATAECQINLSQWREARRLYEEFLQHHAKHAQATLAQSRLSVLKNLERYQKLIADAEVSRNKDDAHFQIGRIVLEQLNNKVKAVTEFEKVVTDFSTSDLADDAQLEIGKALLALDRLDEARQALLEVPSKYPNSPVADDALYLVGQSYEQHALRLASVTVAKARQEAFVRGQLQAYKFFNEQLEVQDLERSGRRAQLKGAGKAQELALDEASDAFRISGANYDAISNTSRQAEIQAETESALEVANRQDRINEAYRQAVAQYVRAASDYPLGDRTDDSLLQVAQILEVNLKDRAAAMQTYQKIVGLFPGTPVAQDAAWKVAQFYEQEGKYADAAAAYRDFIRNYPASPRVADAQFALAEVYEQLGRWIDAMDAYETFRQKFAQHPKAQVAVDQINWIKAYRK